jgi:hypothetical protein
MKRLKSSEIKSYRELQWKAQHGICPLCQQYISPLDAVLDHAHDSGLVRQVLHRSCNSHLGKWENSLKRFAIDPIRAAHIAENIISYIQETHTDILHSTHRTPEEKRELIKKRRARNAKRAKK